MSCTTNSAACALDNAPHRPTDSIKWRYDFISKRASGDPLSQQTIKIIEQRQPHQKQQHDDAHLLSHLLQGF